MYFYMCRMLGMSSETSPVVEPVVAQVARAIELAGGPAKVGRGLRVSTQTVCFWRDGNRQIKAEFGAQLEQMTDLRVTRKDIWPVSWQQIWPELARADTHQPHPTHQEAANA
ncbi:MAG: helix-turn-helix domain-containing protein [Hydrogenophaga sp.]|jgi:DNA-binding transcriptional regulator YdaS (Cro superfamily)|nr:helix-turn-helix domain-containing protein [Hydrogenophaga sp.]